MTDEQIFKIKKAILESRIEFPPEEDESKQEKKCRFKGCIPYIIYFLLLLALGILFAFSNADVKQRLLTSLFVQRLLSH